MKRYYCTYFDSNYLAQGLVLLESLQQHSETDFSLFVLCLDDKVYNFFISSDHKNITPIPLKKLEEFDEELFQIKDTRSWVEYIFTLTPCLTNYLMETEKDIDIISYIDSDIMFFASPEIIFDEFSEGSVFIIPHNFSIRNKHLEIYGKYNVGFVGFRKDVNGIQCIKWWRKKCIEWCYDKLDGDRFADQKYLDQWPDLFNNVIISKNPGLNLASYNLDTFCLNKKKGKYQVGGRDLVFYHYHRLKEINSNLWKLNLLTPSGYQDVIVKNIYSFIISKMKYYKRLNQVYSITHNRYEIDNKSKIWMEFKSNILLFHFGIINGFIDLRKTFSKLVYLYKRIIN